VCKVGYCLMWHYSSVTFLKLSSLSFEVTYVGTGNKLVSANVYELPESLGGKVVVMCQLVTSYTLTL
jgi:hypothetical protein